MSEDKASSQDDHGGQTTTGVAIEHRLVSLGMLFSRKRRIGDLCSRNWEPDGSRQLFEASSKLRDHSLPLLPERCCCCFCLLGNLNRPLRPPYRVPKIFHDSTAKKRKGNIEGDLKPLAHKLFEERNRAITMQMNIIAADRENKILPAKGSKVRHFYPLQLTTRWRRQTRIPFCTLTGWKFKRKTQPQLARRDFTLTSSPSGVAIQLHIASLVTTGNAFWKLVYRAGWQAKMASIAFWIPWCNAHKPHWGTVILQIFGALKFQ